MNVDRKFWQASDPHRVQLTSECTVVNESALMLRG
jgi:hypothetical protein